MIYKYLPFLSILLLAGCSSDTASNLPTNTVTSTQGQWKMRSGWPVSGNSFDFPTAAGPNTANYLTTTVNGLKPGNISMDYTVSGTGNPVFDYRTNPNNTSGPGYPGTVRLFIQRAGDNMSGVGEYQQYRYWSSVTYKDLALGNFSISETLSDPSKWSDVYGKKGSDYPDRFAATVAQAQNVGVTFGGGSFYGHGVFVTGGTAKFTVRAFKNG